MKRNDGPPASTGENADYPVRVSEVGGVYLTSMSSASIAQFGDRADVKASLRGIAVQRESDHLVSNDVYFEAYDIFSQPVPPLSPFLALAAQSDPLEMRTTNREPRISVGCIEIIAASELGPGARRERREHEGRSRISNIRQFARPPLRYYGTGCCPPMTSKAPIVRVPE